MYLNAIVITGGAGFLGRHLCAKLLEDENNYIICIDNLVTGKLKNINDFLNNPRFKFINHDITLNLSFDKFNIDRSMIKEIYNLASIASPDKYKEKSIETIMVNFIGTKNMLELAKECNAKILLTSTSEVYGDPLVHPQGEDYYGNVNTVGERSCYDESKRLAETLMYEYNKCYGINTKIVRIFNTYGPYMDEKDGRIITNFLYKILRDETVEIYGDGEQTRSFCYVDDMVSGLIKMMSSEERGPINIGNPYCEFTINKLVDIFENILDKKIKKVYLPSTENDPKCRKPVINKAMELLAWFPNINIEEGLIKTYEYYAKLKSSKETS